MVLKGKIAIVTGSSRGIGGAIAKILAREGARVVINYRTDELGANMVRDEIASLGGLATAIKADVRERVEADRLIDETIDRYKTIDILVNNAHQPFVPKPFAKIEWKDVQEQIDGTVRSAFNCCQAVLKSMVPRESGKIINVVSVTVDAPDLAFDYGFFTRNTAKAALVGFSRTLAVELAPSGITVNMVSPSWTRTSQSETYLEAVMLRAIERTPLGRLATPHDVAQAVLFYASEWSDFLTGTYLPVSGGAVM
jgi:3-oxoacyl-[acyl-carrier protein] reductase